MRLHFKGQLCGTVGLKKMEDKSCTSFPRGLNHSVLQPGGLQCVLVGRNENRSSYSGFLPQSHIHTHTRTRLMDNSTFFPLVQESEHHQPPPWCRLRLHLLLRQAEDMEMLKLMDLCVGIRIRRPLSENVTKHLDQILCVFPVSAWTL